MNEFKLNIMNSYRTWIDFKLDSIQFKFTHTSTQPFELTITINYINIPLNTRKSDLQLWISLSLSINIRDRNQSRAKVPQSAKYYTIFTRYPELMDPQHLIWDGNCRWVVTKAVRSEGLDLVLRMDDSGCWCDNMKD